MAIGKDFRKTSVRSSIRAPKFLDKSSGFYGRLDEPEAAGAGEERGNRTEDRNGEGGVVSSQSQSMSHISGPYEREDAEVLDFSEGMMEDDGETLLQRKPSRLSSRWRRSSRRKQKEGRAREDAAQGERPSLGTDSPADEPVLEGTAGTAEGETEKLKMEQENEKAGGAREAALVHFPVREDADDQVLIRDKKRGREDEGEEERKMKREQEEGMKVVKRKNYRKALDRAFRRGWEAFIANLYSVTLAPVTSSSSPSSSSPASKKKQLHASVLAEFK